MKLDWDIVGDTVVARPTPGTKRYVINRDNDRALKLTVNGVRSSEPGSLVELMDRAQKYVDGERDTY